MKKTFSAFATIVVFAACQSQIVDPKADFIKQSAACICSYHATSSDQIARLQAATEAEKPAIIKEIDSLSKAVPECLQALKTKENELVGNMNPTEKQTLYKQIESTVAQKCPQAAAAISSSKTHNLDFFSALQQILTNPK